MVADQAFLGYCNIRFHSMYEKKTLGMQSAYKQDAVFKPFTVQVIDENDMQLLLSSAACNMALTALYYV